KAVRTEGCPVSAAALADMAEERGEPDAMVRRWGLFSLWVAPLRKARANATRSNGERHWHDELLPVPGPTTTGYRVRVYHCPRLLFVHLDQWDGASFVPLTNG